MSPHERLDDLRTRGIELRLSDDLRTIEGRGPLTDEDREAIAREKLWLLMLLAHEAGGDAYDPRLAFLASAERGLTAGAIRTRMQTAFGITPALADGLIQLAESAGYLRRRGGLFAPVGDIAAVLARKEVLPA